MRDTPVSGVSRSVSHYSLYWKEDQALFMLIEWVRGSGGETPSQSEFDQSLLFSALPLPPLIGSWYFQFSNLSGLYNTNCIAFQLLHSAGYVLVSWVCHIRWHLLLLSSFYVLLLACLLFSCPCGLMLSYPFVVISVANGSKCLCTICHHELDYIMLFDWILQYQISDHF